MDARSRVDPELLAALDAMPELVLTREGLPLARTTAAQAAQAAQALAPAPAAGVQTTQLTVPGPLGAPPVRVLLARPAVADRPLPVLVWMHGGGFVLHSAEVDQPRAQLLAAAVGCLVASVDYRLAPEAPHPAPVEDCYAVLRAVHARAGELGADPTRIAVGGDSAGGGLAAVLAQVARDRREVPLVLQVLVHPMLDDRTVLEEHPNPWTGQLVWTRESNRFAWTALLGREPGPVAPQYAAAARAEDLSALPPAYLDVGGLDLFVDEDLDYARRLLRAGVPTEVHVHPGAYHGYQVAAGASVTRRHHEAVVAALRRAFALPELLGG